MITDVLDTMTFATLESSSLVAYLEGAGWQITKTNRDAKGDKSSLWVWSKQSDEEYEILLPLRPELGDYRLRLREAIETLSIAEGRSQLDIVAELTTSSADIVRIYVRSVGVSDSTIAMGDGVRLILNIQKMMNAVACSTIEPRFFYPRRKPTQVVNYMKDNVRLGQSGQGSYVVTVVSRLPPIRSFVNRGQQREIESEEDSFERKVLITLVEAISTTLTASKRATATDDLNGFIENVSHGISANFCAALADMLSSDKSEQRELIITISWSRSRSRPTISRSSVEQRFQLPNSSVPTLRRASRILRSKSREELGFEK